MNGYCEVLDCAETLPDVSAYLMPEDRIKPVRIWLVDDNDGFRTLLASILNDEPGFKCSREFYSPEGLLNALSEEAAPDIILLDIEMGKYNGLDAIRPIKSLAKSTHVLMLTTFATPDARERAFREGASDFMLKTWSIPEIAMHIRRAMEFGSVAGLLTAFLGQSRPVEPKKVAPVEKSSVVERWFNSLRGRLKFSPS